MDAGDLHWQRTMAGLYHTQFWANGYRYKIVKDTYYANRWDVYYRWDKWSEKKANDNGKVRWRRFETDIPTLKDAKRACCRHNMRPRVKFKFMGRFTEKDAGHYYKDKIGFWVFKQWDTKTNKPFDYGGSRRFINPATTTKEYWEAKRAAELEKEQNGEVSSRITR